MGLICLAGAVFEVLNRTVQLVAVKVVYFKRPFLFMKEPHGPVHKIAFAVNLHSYISCRIDVAGFTASRVFPA